MHTKIFKFLNSDITNRYFYFQFLIFDSFLYLYFKSSYFYVPIFLANNYEEITIITVDT